MDQTIAENKKTIQTKTREDKKELKGSHPHTKKKHSKKIRVLNIYERIIKDIVVFNQARY